MWYETHSPHEIPNKAETEELYKHGVLSDPYSYVFGLNTEIYQVNSILEERHDIYFILLVLVNIVNVHVSIVKHNKQTQIKTEKIDWHTFQYHKFVFLVLELNNFLRILPSLQ